MSETPSDTSTQPDLPVLLLDENLSDEGIAVFLRSLHKHWRVEVHADHFAKGEKDTEIIKGCAERKWILVSNDDRIRYVPENKSAVLRHRLRAFMFGKGNYQGVEYAAALIVARKEIVRTLARYNSGHLLARVSISGSVNVLEPSREPAAMSSREKTGHKYGLKLDGQDNG